MRSVVILVFPIACLVLVLAWLIAGRSRPALSNTMPERIPLPVNPQKGVPSEMTSLQRGAEKSPPPASPAASALNKQHAFRFILTDGKLALDAVDDIQGDFRPRRGEMAWEAGMFYCRLLDAEKRVLAEETLMAPDHVCVVLDPHTPGADGKPQPARLSPTGPVVFQVRMPGGEAATDMKIYRIQGPRPATPGDEPAGELLATIPLTR